METLLLYNEGRKIRQERRCQNHYFYNQLCKKRFKGGTKLRDDLVMMTFQVKSGEY